jgi:putative membrane protein
MILRFAILAIAIVVSGCARHRATATTSAASTVSADTASDDEFLQFAAMQDRNVIDLSEAAAQRASNPQIRDLARSLRTDRGADFDKISRAARRRNTQLPTESDTRHVDALQRLNQAPPDAFDRDYLNLMISDLEFILSTYQTRAQTASTRNVRSIASDALPALRRDLDRARALAGSATASGRQ